MDSEFDVASKLVWFFGPVFTLWFVAGVAIAVLYHLSLFYLDRDFRKNVAMLDLLFAVLRSILLVVGWPFIFYFDRSYLTRIRLFLLSLDPKQREANEDVKDAIREGRYWAWVQRSFVERERMEDRRRHETETGEEQQRRLRIVHEGNPELERIWMLTGVGANPGGVRQLVRMYPEYHAAEEIAAGARREVELRRSWTCLRCAAPMPAKTVELPELIFLRILNWETDKMLIEGWALDGDYRVVFGPCPKCTTEQPDLTESVGRLGRASDVAKLAREGLSLHWDLP